MTAARARRSAPAPADNRGKLSRDHLVDAALGLVDAEGLDALTLRKLAVALDVTPMAMYWHVADKDALLDALGERIFAGVVLPDRVEHWFEDLCAVAHAIVAELRRHPAAAPLAETTVLTNEAGLRVAERVLSRLSDAGLSDQDAADVGACLLRAIVTLVTALPGATPLGQSAARVQRMHEKRAQLLALPSDRYPVVSRLAPVLVDCDDPDVFLANGINVLMLGIRAFADSVTSA